MGTFAIQDSIANALFDRGRREVLALLFRNWTRRFYLREVIRLTAMGQGATQRELERLTGAGLLLRSQEGRQVYFQANPRSPVFEELKTLMLKTAGLADILRQSLQPFTDRLEIAFVYGSMARGDAGASSDIDVMLIGAVSFHEVVAAFQEAQDRLGREVNPTVYPIAEFVRKKIAERSFLHRVIEGEKIFLVGDESELERLGEERVVGETASRRPGSRRPAGRDRS